MIDTERLIELAAKAARAQAVPDALLATADESTYTNLAQREASQARLDMYAALSPDTVRTLVRAYEQERETRQKALTEAARVCRHQAVVDPIGRERIAAAIERLRDGG